MQKGIIGKKIGMTQIFDEAGKVIPVTLAKLFQDNCSVAPSKAAKDKA